MIPRRRGECNTVRVKNRPGVLRVRVLIGARSRVHAVADAHYGLDVSVKRDLARRERHALVVDDPPHHGRVVSTETVRTRCSQVLRIGNNGNSEVRDGSRRRRYVYEPRGCHPGETAEDRCPKPPSGHLFQKLLRRQAPVLDYIPQFRHRYGTPTPVPWMGIVYHSSRLKTKSSFVAGHARARLLIVVVARRQGRLNVTRPNVIPTSARRISAAAPLYCLLRS